MSADASRNIYEKNKVKNFLHNRTTWIAVLALLVFIILFLLWRCGFRITYAPELENNWDAISAVGEWIGAIIIPFVILWLQHRWDSDKNDIAKSNLITLDHLKELEHRLAPLLKETKGGKEKEPVTERADISSREQQILQFLAINMGATTREIASYTGFSTPTIQRLIQKMIADGKVIAYGTSHGRVYKVAYVPYNFRPEE